jgi:putative salt-induced outer membrane protein YdiY
MSRATPKEQPIRMKNKKNRTPLALRLAPVAALAGIMIQQSPAQAQTAITTNAPPPAWPTTAALGLTLTRGNSDTTTLAANINSEHKTKQYEILLGADGTYGTVSGVENAEQLHGFGQYNYLATDRFYAGVRLDGLHDGIADIRYRATLAPLAGYYFIKETNTTLAGEVGPAFVYQKLGSETSDYATLRLGERFEHKFNAHARLWQTFEILPQVNKFNNYYMDGEIGIETPITEHLSLRSYIDDTYYNVPAAGRLKNDLKWITAIAYKF